MARSDTCHHYLSHCVSLVYLHWVYQPNPIELAAWRLSTTSPVCTICHQHLHPMLLTVLWELLDACFVWLTNSLVIWVCGLLLSFVFEYSQILLLRVALLNSLVTCSCLFMFDVGRIQRAVKAFEKPEHWFVTKAPTFKITLKSRSLHMLKKCP